MLHILGALIAFGLLVAVHEGGHFLVARWLGVEVEKFSIGFGPKIFGYKGKVTEYRLSLIPLGGYVKMKGENPDEEVGDRLGSFSALAWWKRALIGFAGPFTNLIFALLLMIITFGIGKNYMDYSPVIGRITNSNELAEGELNFLQPGDRLVKINGQEIITWTDSYEAIPEGIESLVVLREGQELSFERKISVKTWLNNVLPATSTIIGEVSPGLPAYNAGLQSGDKVRAINGKEVNDWYELREQVQSAENGKVEVEIERDGGRFSKLIELQENLLDGNSVIGITQLLPEQVKETYNFWESIKYGTVSTADIVILNYVGLYKLLLKPSELKNNLGGPVMMYTMSKETAKQGWGSILTFVAMISVILMVMNLLPIPILDGGMIFFCMIEGIRRKALSLRTQLTLQKIGFSVLIILMFFAFSNDFTRLYKRSTSMKSQQTELNSQENNQD